MISTDLATLRLHVRYDEGEGPVFVLLHGINSDATDWRPVIDRIGPHYRCIALDVLGFGESPKPSDIEYTADEHCEVLAATLAELGIAEKFVLVGYSLGGDIAIRYAALHAEEIRRLFLLSTPFYLPPDAYARKKFGPSFFRELLFKALWRVIARQKTKEGVVYELASGRLEDFSKAFLRTGDVSEHWDIMGKNLTNAIGAATFVDDLPKLSMPTVFALGVRDPIVQPDQTAALKRLKPDMEIRRIVGLTADHFMLMNLSERVADEIMADEVDHLHVAYRAGHGPPIVFLPPIDIGAPAWKPAASALSSENEAVVLDLLGFGGSPAPLSSHYSIEDHSSAVLRTLTKLFGDEPVKLVGHGFGAVVALQCAATSPSAVSRVVAFSPTLIPPGTGVASLARDEMVAEILAARESLMELARDERAQAVASERLERHVVPAMRSLESVTEIDAAGLLERLAVPTRVVIPREDAISPKEWIRGLAESKPRFELFEPYGDRQLPFVRPTEALSTIGDVSAGQIYAASIAKPVRGSRRTLLSAALGSANAQLIRRGLLMLLVGLALLLLPAFPLRLIPLGLAI
ncbi:MAG TPA: alpha/beta fold hydrolase, partial [Coriobacteriia bacterium]|nr:alpha/beta fold hydrolase [Coriobacteriia bacterium]